MGNNFGCSTCVITINNYIPRENDFKVLLISSIWLIPFKKDWAHIYKIPNKSFDYAYAGLLVACTSDLKTIYSNLGGNCILFEDYEDLVQKLKYIHDNIEELYKLQVKSFNFAKENLIWERYEHNIMNIYL